MNKSKVICILGSGRTGTSLMAKTINIMGVNLGDNLIEADQTNPKGFWEDAEIVKIHRQLLSRIGRFNYYASKWENDPVVIERKNELINYIDDQFNNSNIWGWKDPKTSQLLDLWKGILKKRNTEVYYIIMIRNPNDVLNSFDRAYGTQKELSLKLWYLRTILSLLKTSGEKRIVVDYNDFIENSLYYFDRIMNQFNISNKESKVSLHSKLRDFISPNLRHSKTTLNELNSNSDIPIEHKNLYKLLKRASHQPKFLESESFERKIKEHFNNYEIKYKGNDFN
ncbi:sulfotransferase family protein [Rossellomorea sp. BNER]|uniref:sulfotransferase family protein n=1 Tax=Rossellomorea sp. BNER TaxID=2962031 RepID=UPI003AF2506F|nr:hypothetical protein [Rossellomorea sp. BNER]